jgi:hypothetical protein
MPTREQGVIRFDCDIKYRMPISSLAAGNFSEPIFGKEADL